MRDFCKDALTGLDTKKYLEEKYISYIMANKDSYVLNIDFCNFKSLNDEHGHCFGDKCLIAASKQFKTNFPDSIIIRKGGDEFIIVTNVSENEIIKRIQNCLKGVKNDETIYELREKISFNCGIVEAKENLCKSLKASDIMMYHAKRNKKLFQLFDETVYLTHIQNENLIDEIDDLVDNDDLVLACNKVYTLQDQFSGIEILVDKKDGGVPLYTEEDYSLLRKNYRLKKIDMYNLEKILSMKVSNPTIIDINYQTVISKEFDFSDYIQSKRSNDIDNIILNINVDDYNNCIQLILEKIKKLEQMGIKISLDNLSSSLVFHDIWCGNDIKYTIVKSNNWKSTNPKEIDILKVWLEVLKKYNTTPIFTGVETEEDILAIKKIGQKVLLTGKYYE